LANPASLFRRLRGFLCGWKEDIFLPGAWKGFNEGYFGVSSCPQASLYLQGKAAGIAVKIVRKSWFQDQFPGRSSHCETDVKIKTVLRRLPAPLIAAGIWFLSSQSTLPKPKGILGFDKLQHLLAYMALAGAAGLWVSPEGWRRRRLFVTVLVAAAASVYGVTDELHQHFVPGRNCNVRDWIADTAGSVIGAAIAAGTAALVSRFRQRKG
jgi:VanZ family protein